MYLLLAIHLCWTGGLAIAIARNKRDPASAAVWMSIVLLLPLVGSLLYLLTGYRPAPPPTGAIPSDGDPLETLIAAGCRTRTTRYNHLQLLHNGSNAFSALILALQRATRSIHLEYYIFRDDRIGRTIAELLVRKARAGVEVRLIYDAVGSWGIGRKMLGRLHEAGVRTAAFEPLRFPWFTPRATRRNHRKIAVTDGKVAFLGGINIAKYYLDGDDMGRWRDEHLRIEGDAVADLQRLFLADWAHATGERLNPKPHIVPHTIRQPLPIQLAWAESGPSRTVLSDTLVALILRARKRICICTPYFLPPPSLLEALRIAVRSGVRIEAMIPACSDSSLLNPLSDSYIDDLLDAGIELYRYEAGFLHAKLLIVDDATASVGTANLDYRSLRDNLEVTAFIRDRRTVGELSSLFEADLTRCRRICRENWHPTPLRRTAGNLLRLLAPLM